MLMHSLLTTKSLIRPIDQGTATVAQKIPEYTHHEGYTKPIRSVTSATVPMKPIRYSSGSPVEILTISLTTLGKFEVAFADGRRFVAFVTVFEMPVHLLRWDTLVVARGGHAITVTDVTDEPVEIDAETVRYFVDPVFAERAKAELAKVQFTRDELKNLARESSLRPATQPEGEFVRTAWR
jgi:hypothetical protein